MPKPQPGHRRHMVLYPYLQEAADLPADTGVTDTIRAAAVKLHTDPSVLYHWLDKGYVPKSRPLLRLIDAVNVVRFTSCDAKRLPVSMDEIREMVGE